MFYVTTNGQNRLGEYADFDDALSRALEVAEEMAVQRSERFEEDIEEVDTFVNGTPGEYPTCNTEEAITWEAGACPEGSDGAYWPHVEWEE